MIFPFQNVLHNMGVFFLVYLIGIIPSGYLFCRYCLGKDVTEHGSGNIGATNVARVFGYRYFIPILLCDAGKAYSALWLVQWLIGMNEMLLFYSGMFLLVGNSFSPLLNFGGGRGVATSLGICAFVLPWQYVLLFMGLWLVVLAITKKPFVASISSMTVLWGIRLYAGTKVETQMLTFMLVWLVLQHYKHIVSWWRRSDQKQPQQDV